MRIGSDYIANTIVELFIFVFILFKFRAKKYKSSGRIGRIWIFIVTYIMWYNYLQAFFDIVYDKKEGVQTSIPFRSTGLSITVTCKMTFGYLCHLILQKGVEITDSEQYNQNTNE